MVAAVHGFMGPCAHARPVHSFRTLLKDLATLTRNRIHPRTAGSQATNSAEFETLTIATPLQHRAFDLLEVPLTL
jgi:hypothetical protein